MGTAQVPRRRCQPGIAGQADFSLLQDRLPDISFCNPPAAGCLSFPGPARDEYSIPCLQAAGVGFVDIDVEIEHKGRIDANQNVREDNVTRFICRIVRPGTYRRNAHPLTVGNPQIGRSLRIGVDVALRDDDAFRKLDNAPRSDDPPAGRSGKIARVSYRRRDPQHSGIGWRNFELRLAPDRTDDANPFDPSLWPFDCQSFMRGKLAALSDWTQDRQLVARSKEQIEMIAGNMKMPIRDPNRNGRCLAHGLAPEIEGKDATAGLPPATLELLDDPFNIALCQPATAVAAL